MEEYYNILWEEVTILMNMELAKFRKFVQENDFAGEEIDDELEVDFNDCGYIVENRQVDGCCSCNRSNNMLQFI